MDFPSCYQQTPNIRDNAKQMTKADSMNPKHGVSKKEGRKELHIGLATNLQPHHLP
jgi:hypothetical protein